MFDADELQSPGRRVARLLADDRPIRRRSSSATSPAASACGTRIAGELRLVGQPAGADGADSPELGDRRLRPGDEVITVAAGFPTTVNPIIQNGLVPVFVDVHHPDLQHRRRRSSKRRCRDAPGRSWSRTRWATRSTSTPSTAFADEHDLWLIEDCCDALGSTYRRPARSARSATWPRSASTRPTTSRWARAVRAHDRAAAEASSSSRSATGAATAGASRARTTPAASGSTGSSASCRTATTTSTSTRTSATT